MSTDAIKLGARLSGQRLRSKAGAVWLLLTVIVAAAIALAEFRSNVSTAPIRTLHAVLDIGLPLTTCAVFGLVSSYTNLRHFAWPLARFGWSRRAVLVGGLILPTVSIVGLWTLTTFLALVLSYGGAGWRADVVATLPIAALAGWAYAGLFALGATWFQGGKGRWVVLCLDWFFGAGIGLFSLPWPRGHVRALLGADLVLNMPTRVSSILLVVIGMCSFGFALRRASK